VSAPHIYCSSLARAAKEPLGGTASHARGCVLLSYPKRLWGPDALASEGLPPALLETLERLRLDHDVVTRLVAHTGTWNERVEVSLFPQNRRHSDVPLAAVAGLLETSDPDDGELLGHPVIACCTHGVRDACCAKFGLALVSALRESALVSGSNVEVREASHLGGDRFAPTLLVLPSGHTYGHLDPSDAPALLAALGGTMPLAARFRGSLWLDPLEQLAEIAAFDVARARSTELTALSAIERTDLAAARARLRCVATLGTERVRLELRCTLQRRLVVGDCRNAARDRRGQAAIWIIDAVSTAAEP